MRVTIGTGDDPIQECSVCYCLCADARALGLHIRRHEARAEPVSRGELRALVLEGIANVDRDRRTLVPQWTQEEMADRAMERLDAAGGVFGVLRARYQALVAELAEHLDLDAGLADALRRAGGETE